MYYKREIQKLNKDNFKAWKELIRLHLETIRYLGIKYLNAKYKASTRTMTIKEIAKKKSHNIMMIDIASSLNYAKFDEVKDCGTTYEMWIKLKTSME